MSDIDNVAAAAPDPDATGALPPLLLVVCYQQYHRSIADTVKISPQNKKQDARPLINWILLKTHILLQIGISILGMAVFAAYEGVIEYVEPLSNP